ncbi:MAG: hypothetical protein HKP29_14220 [Silicimonas sp.]|nr:hypothetical protein [Silicimonas sp.]
MRAVLSIFVAFGLAGCGDWPDLPDTPGSRSGGWPRLAPLSDLERGLGAPTAASDEDAARLAARAEALRRRAAVLRTPVPDQDAFDALRARVGR